MDYPILIVFVGFLYVLLYGVMSYLRREGLSLRFALEAILITLVFGGLAGFGIMKINPIVFLIILYLVTMRVRWIVDLASFFAQRRNFRIADQMYQIASRLWPDHVGKVVVEINQAVSYIQQRKLDEAIEILKQVTQKASEGGIGVKYETAAHYNLAVAHQKKNNETQAIVEFNIVLDIWPVSEYSRRAERALAQLANKRSISPPDKID